MHYNGKLQLAKPTKDWISHCSPTTVPLKARPDRVLKVWYLLTEPVPLISAPQPRAHRRCASILSSIHSLFEFHVHATVPVTCLDLPRAWNPALLRQPAPVDHTDSTMAMTNGAQPSTARGFSFKALLFFLLLAHLSNLSLHFSAQRFLTNTARE